MLYLKIDAKIINVVFLLVGINGTRGNPGESAYL